jgi:hypothetical protein
LDLSPWCVCPVVKVLSFGKVCLHWSRISHAWCSSLNAVVARIPSAWAGALSIGSSVILKSPSIKSGRRRWAARLFLFIIFQKGGWVVLSFGAYTFRSSVSSDLSHLMLSARALQVRNLPNWVQNPNRTGGSGSGPGNLLNRTYIWVPVRRGARPEPEVQQPAAVVYAS